ncbi:hypothetical protein EXN66_Car015179 [Channa argus]|uniref:Uncharacterized protein n=1 Tax=Channa argus TaxID=215402 RepID=A0A6G1QAC5_CHAAH|nr:hypothetical protein EXN66_Car015179 [Channa argus]
MYLARETWPQYKRKDQQQKVVFEAFPLLENKNSHEKCLMFLNRLLKLFQLSSTPQVTK